MKTSYLHIDHFTMNAIILFFVNIEYNMMFYKVGCHVYGDDTLLYISFKCKQPLEAILKLNRCLSDIMRYTNKLKINNLKTSFIVFRYPQLKYDLRGCQ